MAASMADEIPSMDAIKSSFEKQISDGSTVAPARDDFCRDTTMEQDDFMEVCDVYEAKGGMAEKLAWQLPAISEDQPRAASPMFVGEQEFDFYESRGGMAVRLREASKFACDEYEARGGLAAQVECRLPAVRMQPGLCNQPEGNEYESRGGIASLYQSWLPSFQPASSR
mmetsp:Transcript_116663/g.341493  ORF Transcript_116663/g.341493 Transcript_116663/m.341493 type:complete len:169 (+) Transcript_116663:71-577(+)